MMKRAASSTQINAFQNTEKQSKELYLMFKKARNMSNDSMEFSAQQQTASFANNESKQGSSDES